MTKYNKKPSTKITNRAGGEAYEQTTELAFISILLTSFCNSQFYREEQDVYKDLKELITKLDKKFVAKAAIFARNEFGMRSVTHVITGELAKQVKNVDWSKNFYSKIVHRVDDITEILAYYLMNYGKPIPNSLKKGLGIALNKFDEYQIAKYRGSKNTIKLVDAVNLIHPKLTGDADIAIKKLINGTLRSADTWETELSNAGKSKDVEIAKNDAWKKLIKDRKIGYFALLRNLRNIIEQSPEIIDEAINLLVEPELIKRSLILPFRFLTAVSQIEQMNGKDVSRVIIALNKAVDISLENVPELQGETLVVLDTSGSMEGKPKEIGSLFSAILVKKINAELMIFSDCAKYVTLNPMDSTLTLAKSIEFMSGGTDFQSIFTKANKKYDRIIILSDMQGWVGFNSPKEVFIDYKKKYVANPVIYSFDLQGYGDMQFPERNVYCLAGFSEKVFDIMKVFEEDRNALINRIKAVDL